MKIGDHEFPTMFAAVRFLLEHSEEPEHAAMCEAIGIRLRTILECVDKVFSDPKSAHYEALESAATILERLPGNNRLLKAQAELVRAIGDVMRTAFQ